MAEDGRPMGEPRPFASLTSNLLARRGDARPAMRRQAVNHLHLPLADHEDLGWNDIGDDETRPYVPAPVPLGLTPPDQSPVDETEPEEAYGAYEADEPYEEMAAPDAPAVAEPAPPAPISPLTERLEAIAQRINQPPPRDTSFKPMVARKVAPRRTPASNAAAPMGRKAAFTLRIDPERHLRLRLLSALRNTSSQHLLIEALDALLAGHEKVEDLAAQVEARGDVDLDEATRKRHA